MAAERATILTWLSDLSAAIITDAVDLADFANRVTAARNLTAAEFSSEALQLTRIAAESVAGPEDFGRFVAPSDLNDASTIAAFTVLVSIGLAIAGPRIAWPSRPRARAARDTMVAAGEAALAVAAGFGANGSDLYGWLAGLNAMAVRVVSNIAADAVPLVRVETGVSLPSSVLAYKLYGDAARAEGLVDIARSMTPMLMPSVFEALES
jgi:hypothetical protein